MNQVADLKIKINHDFNFFLACKAVPSTVTIRDKFALVLTDTFTSSCEFWRSLDTVCSLNVPPSCEFLGFQAQVVNPGFGGYNMRLSKWYVALIICSKITGLVKIPGNISKESGTSDLVYWDDRKRCSCSTQSSSEILDLEEHYMFWVLRMFSFFIIHTSWFWMVHHHHCKREGKVLGKPLSSIYFLLQYQACLRVFKVDGMSCIAAENIILFCIRWFVVELYFFGVQKCHPRKFRKLEAQFAICAHDVTCECTFAL